MNCGYNTQTGKAIRTTVSKEKEVKAPGATSRRRGGADWGPSFGVLFLIFVGTCVGLCALGAVSPVFWGLGVLLALGMLFVGGIWGIVDAFRQGEAMWGILGVLGFVLGLPGLAFLYYMTFVNELKWSKSIYLGGVVGFIAGIAVALTVLGMSIDDLAPGNAPGTP
jgi:hypothetical protein